MSNAWETTNEDIINVAHNMGFDIGYGEADNISDSLNHSAIEKEALYGDDITEQTEYAYQEIKEQIINGDLI